MLNVLVLGCNGMAGHLVSLYLHEQGHSVLGLARKKSHIVPSIVADATDFTKLKNIINEGNFDAIINCIGILNNFAEENKNIAILLNSYLPHFLAQTTSAKKTKIIHISTDCVFSGKRGNYTETDFPDGESIYDRTKALGELNDDKNITLRSSIIGPDINSNGIGLLNWFLKQTSPVSGYTKSIWTGQTTLQLAKTIEQAIIQDAKGLVNIVPDSSINKFELLKLLNVHLRNNTIEIQEVDGLVVDKSLTRTNYTFNYKIPSYETMIKEMADWINAHKNLYNY